ncbi:MAG: SIS domain-containing protein [Oscillospiraceae bacterium]|nr:SIS domain-containing protein [Oscillospiraceae bacterium]
MTESMERMAQEIAEQARLFDDCSAGVIEQCKAIIERHDFSKKIKKVYITGCGDSYFAGICLRDLFVRTVKIHTEVYQAIEFSRYVCDYEVDDSALVVCISSSGRVSRTVESALRAREKGALSIAVTSKPDSRLAQAANEKVVLEIPDNLGFAPGTKSYCASLLALICVAAALGQSMGTMSDADVKSLFGYISKLGDVMRATVEQSNNMIERYIKAYFVEENPQKIHMFHVLGSGPNWGTAQFGAMKFLEAAGFDSIPQGVEEWAHSQYFTTRPGTHTVVIAPRGEARERAMEILQAVTVMDGKKIVIGEQGDEELARCADIFIPVCGLENIREDLSPLVYAIPLELLAMHISAHSDVPAFDFDNKPWRREENFRQIWGSKIVSLADAKK